ncbi:MAG: hypothetical protein ACRENP_18865 [Longimicrobiales bacterium]
MRATRKPTAVLLMLPLIAMTACSDPGTGPAELDAVDRALADISMMSNMGAGVAGERPQTVPCPFGGSRVTDGMVTTGFADGVYTCVWDLTMAYRHCALRVDTLTIELDGLTHSEGRSRTRVPSAAGQSVVPLELDGRNWGEMTTRLDTRTQTCSFEMRQRYDPIKSEIRLTGTSCGRSIDIARPITNR